jgi:hypothetical protein
MIFLDKLCEQLPQTRQLVEGCRCLRVHNDVIDLAGGIVHDAAKLEAAAPYIFLPAVDTWIEWQDQGAGNIGMFFGGVGESVTMGRGFFAAHRFKDPEDSGDMLLFNYDLETYQINHLPHPEMDMHDRAIHAKATAELKPIIFAILALINSPKIIRSKEIDITRLNKKRASLGRYTFHPHHEVRLNVDKRVISTVKGESDGASKCLHFVRTHLRFVPSQGGYTMVQPHWRGDPALGIRDTHYYADRQNSRWPD